MSGVVCESECNYEGLREERREGEEKRGKIRDRSPRYHLAWETWGRARTPPPSSSPGPYRDRLKKGSRPKRATIPVAAAVRCGQLHWTNPLSSRPNAHLAQPMQGLRIRYLPTPQNLRHIPRTGDMASRNFQAQPLCDSTGSLAPSQPLPCFGLTG